MRNLTILAYHRVHPGRRGALCVTPADLEQQLGTLLRRGLRPLRGADLLGALPAADASRTRQARPAAADAPAGGRIIPSAWSVPRALPGPPGFLVTFDDGYSDFGRHAWPVLRRLGVPAVVFLVHDRVGLGEPFPWEGRYNSQPGPEDLPLDWREVEGLAAEGCEFGSHTLSHPDLDRIPAAQARAEIAESRRKLAARLGAEIAMFCYPRGVYSTALAEAAAGAGYGAALLTPRRARLHEHRYCLRRVGVYAADRGWRYRLKISPVFDALREARLRWMPPRPASFS